MPGRLYESLSENSTSGEDTIPTTIPGIRLPGRIPGILVLRGHSTTVLAVEDYFSLFWILLVL